MNTAHDRITVSIERPLLERIRADAQAQNRSVSQQIEWLARHGLARLDESAAPAPTVPRATP